MRKAMAYLYITPHKEVVCCLVPSLHNKGCQVLCNIGTKQDGLQKSFYLKCRSDDLHLIACSPAAQQANWSYWTGLLNEPHTFGQDCAFQWEQRKRVTYHINHWRMTLAARRVQWHVASIVLWHVARIVPWHVVGIVPWHVSPHSAVVCGTHSAVTFVSHSTI